MSPALADRFSSIVSPGKFPGVFFICVLPSAPPNLAGALQSSSEKSESVLGWMMAKGGLLVMALLCVGGGGAQRGGLRSLHSIPGRWESPPTQCSRGFAPSPLAPRPQMEARVSREHCLVTLGGRQSPELPRRSRPLCPAGMEWDEDGEVETGSDVCSRQAWS